MPDNGYIAVAVATAAAMTWALRALPFALLAALRSSELLSHLGERMPVGVMVILVVYTLRHVEVVDTAGSWPAAVALAVTASLHLWRGSAIVSIVAGTAANVALTPLAV